MGQEQEGGLLNQQAEPSKGGTTHRDLGGSNSLHFNIATKTRNDPELSVCTRPIIFVYQREDAILKRSPSRARNATTFYRRLSYQNLQYRIRI